MGFSQLESKKIIDACLANVARVAKGKESAEERLSKIKLQLVLVESVLSSTEKKKKKKSKKRKLSDGESTSSVEIVEAAEPSK